MKKGNTKQNRFLHANEHHARGSMVCPTCKGKCFVITGNKIMNNEGKRTILPTCQTCNGTGKI